MEFLTPESNREIIPSILALMDGLTISEAESIINSVSVEIKNTRINTQEVEVTGERVIEGFNPMV